MAEANKKQTITVSFAQHQEPNPEASIKAGRPIFDDIEVCEIRFPGDTKCWAVFPAHEAEPNATREKGFVVTYAEHYNEQYLKFKAREQQTVAGTPLSEAPFLTEGKRRELRAVNIHTVEQLAGLDGANLKSLGMGGRDWKNQATAYLAAAAGTADMTGMAAEIARLKESLAIALANQSLGVAPAPAPAPAAEAGEKKEKSVDDCSDAELRDFIKAETGKPAPHNAKRPALLARATELATKEPAAA